MQKNDDRLDVGHVVMNRDDVQAGASTALATTSDPIASLNDVIVTSPYFDVASVRLRYTPQPRRVRQALRGV